MEEIAKEEQQTARELLPEWQQAIMAIEDQYTDRLQKIQQDVKTQVMSEQEGAAASQAAWLQANAAIQKSEEETRDKLASGLQNLFEHPEKYFEDNAMKMGYQMLANQMLPMFEHGGMMGGALQAMFGMGPQMSTSKNPITDMNSVLGGGHGAAGLSTMSNPSMMQFSQGSTLIQSSGEIFQQAVGQFQSAVSRIGTPGMPGAGSGAGGGIPGVGMAGGSNTGSGAPGGPAGLAGAGLPSISPALGMPAGSYPNMPGSGNQYVNASSLTGTGSSSSSSFGVNLPAAEGPLAMPAGGYPDMPQNSYPTVDASTLTGTGSSSSLSNMPPGTYPGQMPSGQQMMGAGMGLATGAVGVYSAFKNSNPLAGAMSGMSAGMSVGALFGPVGAGIGAVLGGLAGMFAGIFGDQGKAKAEALDVNTIQPAITADMQQYEAGASGYESVASTMENMLISAQNQTNSWGSGARKYFQSNIEPEIDTVLSQLQKQQASGRNAVTLSAAQYHTGGWVDDFGDLGTGGTEGFIHAMQNEFVVNPTAASAHAPILSAMNSGINFGYSSTVHPRMPASSASGGVNLTIKAWDSKDVATWAKTGGGRSLVAAMNQAQGQYSGTGRG